MRSPRQALRAFVIALCGVGLGIALSKASGGSLAVVVAIILGAGFFALARLRGR